MMSLQDNLRAFFKPGYGVHLQAFAAGLTPDPPLWVDEWSDANMVIPPDLGSAEPGPYRLARTPFARDVMRALSPGHPARRVVVKGASQLLKTQVGLNWACAMIARAPANMIILQPTDKLAKRVSSRFDKIAAAVAPVAETVAKKRSRDNRNTIDTKEFKGGTLWVLTGRSSSNLSEASAKYVYADEVDRILRELKGEGDPIALLEKRQSIFGTKAKGYFTSSPTEVGLSRIDELFQQGNQHQLYVPCPHCGAMQRLEWENLHVDQATGKAWMACIANGCMIEEHEKPRMLARHEWRPQAIGDGETWSYEISYLYAPFGWDSWGKMHREYVEAKEAQKIGNDEKLQVFWNTRLARCWTPISSSITVDSLMAKADLYPRGVAPAQAAIVTAAVDVQRNRIEVQLVGWGFGDNGLECWIFDVAVIYGDPTMPNVWSDLDQLICTPVRHAHGSELMIRAVAIDSGDGDSTQEVYDFVKRRKSRMVNGQSQSVIAIKGSSSRSKPIIAGRPTKVELTKRGKPARNSPEVWSVGGDTAKDWIYNRLALEETRIIHTSHEFERGFYEQLLAEAKVTVWSGGRRIRKYEKIRKHDPNEQLDMLAYNLACAHYLGLPSYTGARWNTLLKFIANSATESSPLATELPAPSVSCMVSLDGWARGR